MRIKKNTLITGTIILTVTGLASRLIGFFYRIFLSRLFGEENMGIYQLIGPVMALVFFPVRGRAAERHFQVRGR